MGIRRLLCRQNLDPRPIGVGYEMQARAWGIVRDDAAHLLMQLPNRRVIRHAERDMGIGARICGRIRALGIEHQLDFNRRRIVDHEHMNLGPAAKSHTPAFAKTQRFLVKRYRFLKTCGAHCPMREQRLLSRFHRLPLLGGFAEIRPQF